jgi:hypothetical protein
MALSHPNRRAGRTATQVLVALGVAGTIGVSALAYTDTHTASSTTGTTTGSTQDDTSTGSSGSSADDGTGTVPQVGAGSGASHARSSGS